MSSDIKTPLELLICNFRKWWRHKLRDDVTNWVIVCQSTVSHVILHGSEFVSTGNWTDRKVLIIMVESNEQSSLLKQHRGSSSNSTTAESITGVHFKVYKRRWYVLSVFTAQAFIFNMAWNTWGPIQEPSKVAFGWTDFDLLLLSSWAAIALLATSLPLTWLMDSKGLCLIFSCKSRSLCTVLGVSSASTGS